mmetsp:Transcript_62952/g.124441  ORF Transcript_62952/g.124441 Transcript_62952/m.124441 type:complete len:85 (-) Transcript_62952:290-544(-)
MRPGGSTAALFFAVMMTFWGTFHDLGVKCNIDTEIDAAATRLGETCTVTLAAGRALSTMLKAVWPPFSLITNSDGRLIETPAVS